jgi:hypothetical protein
MGGGRTRIDSGNLSCQHWAPTKTQRESILANVIERFAAVVTVVFLAREAVKLTAVAVDVAPRTNCTSIVAPAKEVLLVAAETLQAFQEIVAV